MGPPESVCSILPLSLLIQLGLGNVPWVPRLLEAITLTTKLHPLLTAIQLSVWMLLTHTALHWF